MKLSNGNRVVDGKSLFPTSLKLRWAQRPLGFAGFPFFGETKTALRGFYAISHGKGVCLCLCHVFRTFEYSHQTEGVNSASYSIQYIAWHVIMYYLLFSAIAKNSK